MTRILCRLGFHRWARLPNQLGAYGMGLEWFELRRCSRCGLVQDRPANVGYRADPRDGVRAVPPAEPPAEEVRAGAEPEGGEATAKNFVREFGMAERIVALAASPPPRKARDA